MFESKDLCITIPQPVKCHCGEGLLLPILQPVTEHVITFNIGKVEKWGNKYQLTWKYSKCEV